MWEDTGMDFSLTEEQEELRQQIVRLARNELNEGVVDRDADGTFPRDAWKKCAALGIQGLPVPEEFGGQGADPLTIVLALEALGYGCTDNGLVFSIGAHLWACATPIAKFGTEEQKHRWLPGLADGSLIGGQAMTEPGTGSDAFGLRTTARRDGDRWILNGAKTFATNAPVADVLVVFASTDPSKRFGGISAFLVEPGTPGMTVGNPLHKMGLRTSPMSEVAFDECAIPDRALLGGVGAGVVVFNHSMDWERSCILANTVGAMQRQLERSIEYANERAQFGQPIGKFQAVSHRIADMKVRLETARLLLYQQAWKKSRGRTSPLDAAMVKLYLSECFLHSSLDALQIHGGYGYMAEYELEREVRDAVGSRLYSGTSDIQRNIIAAYLGL
jgi:alkylation response protein AidB-like acyl-CoA dehydrogenase